MLRPDPCSLIRLSGKEPDTDIKLEFTGLRPGEKLYEELITEGEGIVPTRHEKIMVLRPENGMDRAWLERELGELKELASRHDAGAIKAKRNGLIPEYIIHEADAVL